MKERTLKVKYWDCECTCIIQKVQDNDKYTLLIGLKEYPTEERRNKLINKVIDDYKIQSVLFAKE